MDRVRVSAGSAALLGLAPTKVLVQPTTIHLLQHAGGGCSANCAFCPQARESAVDKRMLSRVSWPAFPWQDVLSRMVDGHARGSFQRVCLQTVSHPSFVEDLFTAVGDLTAKVPVPVSVALVPVAGRVLERLNDAGVDRVGIALDAATPELFSSVKGKDARGPYTWESHWKALLDARDVFGRFRVSTHVIVGLGETERDIALLVQRLHDEGITVGLFAFMPVHGTPLAGAPRPALASFRRVQLARFLVTTGAARADAFSFSPVDGRIVAWGRDDDAVIATVRDHRGSMFRTTGCPSCNRPFYTSSPGGPTYNHPAPLGARDLEAAIALVFPGTSKTGEAILP